MKIIKNKKIILTSILLLSCFFLASSFVYADNDKKKIDKEIKSLEGQVNSLTKSIEALSRKYNEEAKQYSKQEQELAEINTKIMHQLEEIEKTDQKIEKKIIEVENKKAEVEAAKEQVEKYKVSLRKRLRVMYKFGKTGYLQILLKSDSLVNALTRLDRVKFLAEYDKDTLEKLRQLKEQLEINQKELEQEQKELEDLREEQVKQKDELEKSYEQSLAKKKQIYSNMEAAKRQKRQLQLESAKVTEELKKMKAKRAYVGGQMAWPLDLKNRTITSYFGRRRSPTAGASRNHGAIDIAAPTGDNIYAALDGTVYSSSYSGGYGNMVIINHGGGVTTLYAHASARLVSAGQKVTQGQAIARVGSTGISTGPHLHFEVRVNGIRRDPLNYVNAP